MKAWEKWSAKQKPEEVLSPEEYDKKYGTNHANDNPKPFSITVLKKPSKKDPQFDSSGRCKFHNIDIAESFEGMVCDCWRTKGIVTIDGFRTMIFKKLAPNYLYHWVYEIELPKKPIIIHRTDTGYVLIRKRKIDPKRKPELFFCYSKTRH